ncbi:MAG: fumarate hydratase [Ignisphaera sp.]|nr:fumarate hydratase [Ignisphaera sp.]MCX8167724.1 fumarate hydratase [Ignisphaera sp.]MDW8085288.1 fumarate hydratase [Ignisphaera sp.]
MNTRILEEAIERAALEAITRSVIYIPPDVKEALKRIYSEEESESSRSQIGAILRNIELAERMKRPVCQDTGILLYYVRVGYEFPSIKIIEKSLVNAAKVATKTIPLRPNTVNPLTGRNPGDNTGRYMPYINIEFIDGDILEFTVVPKGGGSEYVSVLYMPPPGEGVKAIKRAVVDAVLRAGPMPCPPTIVGVGIGGGADIALHIAKKAACLRRLGSPNPAPELDKLERELYVALNELGIGAMGVGGRFTVLAVHIDYAYRHPAILPIGIVFQCWAVRRATAVVEPNGSYKVFQ